MSFGKTSNNLELWLINFFVIFKGKKDNASYKTSWLSCDFMSNVQSRKNNQYFQDRFADYYLICQMLDKQMLVGMFWA